MVAYAAPETVEEACRLLADNSTARVFAGATDMLPQARAGRSLPDTLVDLKRIPRLVGVSRSDDRWLIGAAVPAHRLTSNERLVSDFPGLTEGIGLIGSDQIQSRASLGGNLCNASPAADTGPSLVVNRATAIVASKSGERRLPVTQVCVGPGQTSLQEGEFIVEFELEQPQDRTSDAYMRMTPRTEMDIAVVGAAARICLSEGGEVVSADVVLGAVAPTAISVPEISDLLVGKPIDRKLLQETAALSTAAANPINDRRGTAEYRRHVAGILAKRVIALAGERAMKR